MFKYFGSHSRNRLCWLPPLSPTPQCSRTQVPSIRKKNTLMRRFYLIGVISAMSTEAFRQPNHFTPAQRFKREGVVFAEVEAAAAVLIQGRRLDPNDVANLTRKELTHLLILPGFASSTNDYTQEGSLAPSLGMCGWQKEHIHVLPMERTDWLSVWKYGLMDSDFIAALTGGSGSGAPPDRLPYRWYLKRVAQAVRDIDRQVKSEQGPNAKAKIILIGHSAGGWLGRAAIGFGHEHIQNSTKLEPEIGIDINNILAFVSLGSPQKGPEGSPDVTGGATRITNERFPGSWFEDKMFYVTAAGSGKNGTMARQSYEMVSGRGTANGDGVDGDGIVSLQMAHLEGATQINIPNISHAIQLSSESDPLAWYGSPVVVAEWFGEVMNQLTYIQGGEKALKEAPEEAGTAPVEAAEEREGKYVQQTDKSGPNFVEDYFCRRNSLRYSGIFNTISNKKAYESLVYSMEGNTLPDGTKLISQGDASDSIFFVKSGEFECYDEESGKVKATVGKYGVIGELGTLLGQPRALSVRAATSDAIVYQLSSEDIKKYTTAEECVEEGSHLEDDKRYGSYFEEREKRQALKACSLFKELKEDDVERLVASMQRVEIPALTRIILEGTEGKAMYFVKDGSFACYRESSQNVVKLCKRLDYFGELGVIFEKPRAVSVRATEPSIVYELKGDAFLDCYRKMTAAKLGASAWLLPLVPLGKLLRPLIPRPISSLVYKTHFAIRHLINRYQLTGQHFEDNARRGTGTHLINAILSAVIPIFFRSSAGSMLSKVVMNVGFAGLVFDNLVNASGKYIGEGNALRQLCKMRTIMHSLTIPLLFLPVIEAAMKSGLFPAWASNVAMAAVTGFALHEVIDWILFDINDMVLVDNRDEKKHSPRALAGTLWYSSGKVLKNVLPAAVLQLFTLMIGSILWRRGAAEGPWLFASGALTLMSCSLQRPDVQAFGEPAMLGLIYVASTATAL